MNGFERGPLVAGSFGRDHWYWEHMCKSTTLWRILFFNGEIEGADGQAGETCGHKYGGFETCNAHILTKFILRRRWYFTSEIMLPGNVLQQYTITRIYGQWEEHTYVDRRLKFHG